MKRELEGKVARVEVRYEEEVSLRLDFEGKIIHLSNENRRLEEKVKRMMI